MNEVLVTKILNTRGGREVCPDTVRRLVEECAARYKKPKDVEKAAREKLHGITGAFMTASEVKTAAQALANRDYETALMQHSSTRERMPIGEMSLMYERIFEITGLPERVLDLACGLNPIFLGSRYAFRTEGIDISGACVRLINESGLPNVSARLGDLVCPLTLPEAHYDVALLFKVLPLLIRQRTDGVKTLFDTVHADIFVVSFPLRTLSGKNIGMEEHYTRMMDENLPAGMGVKARILMKDKELFYILTRNSTAYRYVPLL